MSLLKKLDVAGLLIVLALLLVFTLSTVFGLEFRVFAAKAFFAGWLLMVVLYAVLSKNIYGLLILPFGFIVATYYFYLFNDELPALASLQTISNVVLTIFTIAFGVRLYQNNLFDDKTAITYAAMLVLLVLQIIFKDFTTIETISINGILNYLSLVAIGTIFLNDYLLNPLQKGERYILKLLAIEYGYRIALIIIFQFA